MFAPSHHCATLSRVSELSPENRAELTRWAQSRTLPAGDLLRGRLILALADGKSWNQIQVELQTSRPTIARWKKRFEELGLAGLDPRHKGSTPRTAPPSVQARVLHKSTQRPTDGSTHWSCRKMAVRLGLSKSTVQRIWPTGTPEATSVGSVHGQQRSAVRGEGRRHYRCLHEAVTARGGVLRR